jgi:50S ribosomal protein L16 3-hydroxylase
MILDKMPEPQEFYAQYWGKKPFIVKGAIDPKLFDTLIDKDSLAGLSLEEDIKSRIITTLPEGNKWTCEHGPFSEDYFTKLGEKNWSLLVQNVEQYHLDTAALLKNFHFSPRWLLDDIMISYSTAGGSVGLHVDSYHVFLVQGMGKRRWTIGDAKIENENYIEGLDLKVLKDGVKGQTVEVTIGDVIYIPPHFAHEGITIEEAMTFSVGFLGPKLSDLMIDYGRYLSELEAVDPRYIGESLDADSAGLRVAEKESMRFQDSLIRAVQAPHFASWLAQYLSTPTHVDVDEIESREDTLTETELLARLQNGGILYRQEHVKLVMVDKTLSLLGESFALTAEQQSLFHWLNDHDCISLGDIETIGSTSEVIDLITMLYNKGALD